jgi:putative phosphoesterase
MKALILSDIHSNIFALEAIWTQEQDCDIVYCTGDFVDYGPFPKEVLDWVRAHDVNCTVGNHDRWVVKTYRAGIFRDNIPVDELAWVHHNASLLAEEDILYLENLPKVISFNIAGINYGMTHLYKKYDEIKSLHAYDVFREQAFVGSGDSDFSRLILGHTHRQCLHYLSDEVLWFNPGSVSYRRSDDPDQTAHYATITGGTISLKRLPYDLTPLRQYVQGVPLKESEIQVADRFFGKR